MSGIVENFVRRVEKLVSSSPTVPPAGTNHVDDTWLSTDIYPGELGIFLEEGSLFTSDGSAIIKLNSEDAIMVGLVVQNDTSGTNKITVTSGEARINGITYYHTSSGTDLQFPANIGSDSILYFVYAEATQATGSSGPLMGITATSISGSVDEPGIFSAVAATAGTPAPPDNSVLLGAVLMSPSGSYNLFPRPVTLLGDYYPKFSLTPSDFLRSTDNDVELYQNSMLYFPGQFVIDDASNSSYLAKRIFVSDPGAIANDIGLGNLVQLSGSGGTGGGTYTATNVGSGTVGIYQNTVSNQFRFRTIVASGLIQVGYTGAGNTSIAIGLNTSGLVTSLANVGTGATVYAGLTSTSIANLRSITGGANVSVSVVGNNIVVSVPSIGTTSQGLNLGAGASADVYAGMSGADLTFRRLAGATGMRVTQNANSIILESTGRDNNGVNAGGGLAQIYAGMSGDNLIFRSITGGSNVTVSQVGNLVTISAAAGSGYTGAGANVGGSGAGFGQIFKGMSGSDMQFRSLTGGNNVLITQTGNNIQIDATVSNGVQGPQGFQGLAGSSGSNGSQGFQGPQASGFTGASGAQGAQGASGFQGPVGSQGFQGMTGPAGTPEPMRVIELYDSIGGWTVLAGGQSYIYFNTQRVADAIYTVDQLSNPFSTAGTTISTSESGIYEITYTVSVISVVGTKSTYTIVNKTTGIETLGTHSFVQENGSGSVTNTVTCKAILGLTAGDYYGIRCYVDSLGTQVSGAQYGSIFSIVKLSGSLGTQGPQGLANGGTGSQGFQGPVGSGSQGFQGSQGPSNIGSTFSLSQILAQGATTGPSNLTFNYPYLSDWSSLTHSSSGTYYIDMLTSPPNKYIVVDADITISPDFTTSARNVIKLYGEAGGPYNITWDTGIWLKPVSLTLPTTIAADETIILELLGDDTSGRVIIMKCESYEGA